MLHSAKLPTHPSIPSQTLAQCKNAKPAASFPKAGWNALQKPPKRELSLTGAGGNGPATIRGPRILIDTTSSPTLAAGFKLVRLPSSPSASGRRQSRPPWPFAPESGEPARCSRSSKKNKGWDLQSKSRKARLAPGDIIVCGGESLFRAGRGHIGLIADLRARHHQKRSEGKTEVRFPSKVASFQLHSCSD